MAGKEFVDGVDLPASDLNTYFAQGYLGSMSFTTSATPITTEVDIGSTVVVSVPTGHRVLILVAFQDWYSTVTNDTAAFRIKEGATVLNEIHGICPLANNPAIGGNALMWLGSPTAGSHTYKLSAVRLGGSGNITIDASATSPGTMVVLDIGT